MRWRHCVTRMMVECVKTSMASIPCHLPNNVEQLSTSAISGIFLFEMTHQVQISAGNTGAHQISEYSESINHFPNEIVDRPSVTSFGLTHMSRVQVRRYLTLRHTHTQLHSLRLLNAGLWHTKECGALFVLLSCFYGLSLSLSLSLLVTRFTVNPNETDYAAGFRSLLNARLFRLTAREIRSRRSLPDYTAPNWPPL